MARSSLYSASGVDTVSRVNLRSEEARRLEQWVPGHDEATTAQGSGRKNAPSSVSSL